MVLRVCCKFSLVYLGIENIIVGTLAIEKFVLGGLAGWLHNFLTNLGGREESRKATEGSSL